MRNTTLLFTTLVMTAGPPQLNANMSHEKISRRTALALAASATGELATGANRPTLSKGTESPQRIGSLMQSVCRWRFGGIELDALCAAIDYIKNFGKASLRRASHNSIAYPAELNLGFYVPSGHRM